MSYHNKISFKKVLLEAVNIKKNSGEKNNKFFDFSRQTK